MGHHMVRLQPVHGFAAQTTAAAVIEAATHFGIPLSTTHVISGSIMGVGASKRLSAVKWGVAGRMIWAWVLTLPVTGGLAYCLGGRSLYWGGWSPQYLSSEMHTAPIGAISAGLVLALVPGLLNGFTLPFGLASWAGSPAGEVPAILASGDNTIPRKATRQALFSQASNGFANHSPSGFAFWAVVITEVVFTALFILVIAGTTRSSAIAGFAGIPIGLMLALIHMITIPIDNTSVNPARSFATVLFGQSWGWEQLWVFIVFPMIGGLIGAGIWRFVTTAEDG